MKGDSFCLWAKPKAVTNQRKEKNTFYTNITPNTQDPGTEINLLPSHVILWHTFWCKGMYSGLFIQLWDVNNKLLLSIYHGCTHEVVPMYKYVYSFLLQGVKQKFVIDSADKNSYWMGLRHLTDWLLTDLDFFHPSTSTVSNPAVKIYPTKGINFNGHLYEKYSFDVLLRNNLFLKDLWFWQSFIWSVKCQSFNCLKPCWILPDVLSLAVIHCKYKNYRIWISCVISKDGDK